MAAAAAATSPSLQISSGLGKMLKADGGVVPSGPGTGGHDGRRKPPCGIGNTIPQCSLCRRLLAVVKGGGPTDPAQVLSEAGLVTGLELVHTDGDQSPAVIIGIPSHNTAVPAISLACWSGLRAVDGGDIHRDTRLGSTAAPSATAYICWFPSMPQWDGTPCR